MTVLEYMGDDERGFPTFAAVAGQVYDLTTLHLDPELWADLDLDVRQNAGQPVRIAVDIRKAD
jgi:hypothetical protein